MLIEIYGNTLIANSIEGLRDCCYHSEDGQEILATFSHKDFLTSAEMEAELATILDDAMTKGATSIKFTDITYNLQSEKSSNDEVIA
jgi:hypothetical protein